MILIITSIISLVYLGLIALLYRGLMKLPQPQESNQPEISVIIAARNEESHLDETLTALASQSYPSAKFEVIVVDDRSTDRTAEIVCNWQMSMYNLRLVRIKAEKPGLIGKKNALNEGIARAQYDWLLFTDGDCAPGPDWLDAMARFMKPEIHAVIGYAPFTLPKNVHFWLQLRSVERMAMSAIYAAGVGWGHGVAAVGRNWAYRKSLFLAVDGFHGIGHLRTGDDDLLIHKFDRLRETHFAYAYLPEAHVYSDPPENIEEFIEQENRRHSKIRFYPPYIKILGGLAGLMYLQIICLLVLSFVNWKLSLLFLIIFVIKIIADYVFLSKYCHLVAEGHLKRYIMLTEIFHLPFVLFFSALGSVRKFRWT